MTEETVIERKRTLHSAEIEKAFRAVIPGFNIEDLHEIEQDFLDSKQEFIITLTTREVVSDAKKSTSA